MQEETKDVRATPTSEDKDAKLVTGVARGESQKEDRKEDNQPKDE